MITVLGKKTTRDELKTIEVKRPDRAGSRWQGVQHYDLVQSLTKQLGQHGIEIIDENFAISNDGQSLFGGIEVSFSNDHKMPILDGMNYSIGIRHSNDLSRSMLLTVGSRVLVCANGVITGEFALCRRHTIGVVLGDEMSKGVDRVIEEAQKVNSIVAQMKERKLSRKASDNMLMEAGRQGLIRWSKIGKVVREYDNPTHSDFRQRTAWGLYNAWNHIVKEAPVVQQFGALSGFRDIVLN